MTTCVLHRQAGCIVNGAWFFSPHQPAPGLLCTLLYVLQGDEYDRRLGAKSFDDDAASESEEEGEDDESDNPLDIDPADKVAFVMYDGV